MLQSYQILLQKVRQKSNTSEMLGVKLMKYGLIPLIFIGAGFCLVGGFACETTSCGIWKILA